MKIIQKKFMAVQLETGLAESNIASLLLGL